MSPKRTCQDSHAVPINPILFSLRSRVKLYHTVALFWQLSRELFFSLMVFNAEGFASSSGNLQLTQTALLVS